jgi:FkbM family methyltransferase
MNTEFRSALNKDWLWPLRDRKAWPYLTREENLTFPKTISNLIENKRTVIQAGGHCGLYPYQYSNLFEKVYTFEPEFTNFQCLTENVKGLENVNVFNLGIGNKNESRGINFSKSNSGKHSISNESGGIEIITVDSMNISNVDLIHFDLEGFELFALQGSIKTIEKYKPLIVLETNDLCLSFGYSLQDLDKWLESINYRKLITWQDDTAYIHI